MEDRSETEISQREVPKTPTPERSRNRWATPDEAQTSSVDGNRSMKAPQSSQKRIDPVNWDFHEISLSSGKTVDTY